MKKILLIYYSGTYNTFYLTKLLMEKLNLTSSNFEVTLLDITNWDQKTIPTISNEYLYIGIGYPIYGFNCPKIVEKFIKVCKLTNYNYFVYKTSGEPLAFNNSSSHRIIRLMNKHNNTLYGEFHFLMPYNIILRHSDAMVKKMLYSNNLYLDYIVNNLVNKTIINNQYKSLNLLTLICKLQRIGAPLNSYLYKVDKKKCTKCLKCVNQCPQHNIILKSNKIHFKNKCLMCMRCSFYCPCNAIKIGFLNKWRVNGKYDFENIVNDSKITPNCEITNHPYLLKQYQLYFEKIESLLK